jgi:hypothetical protein
MTLKLNTHEVGRNVLVASEEVEINGKVVKALIFIIDPTVDLGPSSTGKTHLVASAQAPLPYSLAGDLKVGLNLMKKA